MGWFPAGLQGTSGGDDSSGGGGLPILAQLNSYALQWYNTIVGPRQQQTAPTVGIPQGSTTSRSWFSVNGTNLIIFVLLGLGVAFGIRAATRR